MSLLGHRQQGLLNRSWLGCVLLTRVAAAEEPQQAPLPVAPPAASAQGDSAKLACANAYEQSQRLRQDGKLIQAKAEALICAQTSCPTLLVGDCTTWLVELDVAIASVVVGVRDASGQAVSAVSVSVDGELIGSALDGRAIAVDPGRRLFAVVLENGKLLERTVVVAEGQKGQRIDFALAPPQPQGIEARPPRKRLPPLAYAAAAVSGVGVAGFAYFGLTGKAEERALERDCAPSCNDSELSRVRNRYLAADISLGTGIAALSLFGYLWFTRADEPSTGVSAVVSPQSASLAYRERF